MRTNRSNARALCQYHRDAREPSRLLLSRRSPKNKARCPMSKLLAIVATLKAILIAASIASARGEILPVILISVLFNLQLGAKPIGQTMPRNSVAVLENNDRGRWVQNYQSPWASPWRLDAFHLN